MPSLNHVSKWSASDHQWIPITADEASVSFPSTVRANSGWFRCELCGKLVMLTGPGVNTRHFRHSKADEIKECVERSVAYTQFNSYYSSLKDIVSQAGLPIRIIVDENNRSFRFEIGLHSIPNEILQSISLRQFEIKGSLENTFVYSLDRLKTDTTTYLSIGHNPSEKYELTIDKALQTYWPTEVEGIRKTGSIFDAKTGHLKRSDADVIVGKQYYILTKQSYLHMLSPVSVHVDIVCYIALKNGLWYLYRVSADEMTPEAYQFFLQYNCRLTEQPARLLPLWPVMTRTSYSANANQAPLYFYLSGGYIKYNAPDARSQEKLTQGGNLLVKVKPDKFPQLISSGRTSVINYLYIWKDSLSKTQSAPCIHVESRNGDEIQQGTHNTLPDNKCLYITCPFDGMLIVRKNGVIIDKKTIKSNVRLPVFDVSFGCEIRITQGLDCVWSALFQKAVKVNCDDELFKKLCSYTGNEVKLTHKDGAFVSKLNDCPKVKQWLYARIRIGSAPSAAIKCLKKYITEQHNG